jgi:hypothetical protein
MSQARNQDEAGRKQSPQRTTRRYIPEDRTLHNHRCENLHTKILTQYALMYYNYVALQYTVRYLT